MKTPSSFEWLAEKGFGAIIGNPYQVDPDLQGALDIYLDVQSKKGLDAATGNVWALLNAFCHEDDAFARSYPRESIELSIQTHRKYSSPFERGGEIPADYKAYSDWFDKHDKQSYRAGAEFASDADGRPGPHHGQDAYRHRHGLAQHHAAHVAWRRNGSRQGLRVDEIVRARGDPGGHRARGSCGLSQQLADRIRAVLALDPPAPAIEYRGCVDGLAGARGHRRSTSKTSWLQSV